MAYSPRSTHYNSRRTGSWNRNQNTTRFSSPVKLGPVTHTVLVALMVTVLGLIYLTQAASVTGYDYEVQKIDSKIAELSNEKSDLEVENARLTALETVRTSTVARQMTAPSETNYYNR